LINKEKKALANATFCHSPTLSSSPVRREGCLRNPVSGFLGGGETGFLISGFGGEAKVVAETRFLGFWVSGFLGGGETGFLI
jgi:hypothetical protein